MLSIEISKFQTIRQCFIVHNLDCAISGTGLALFEELIQMEHAEGVISHLHEHVEIKWRFEEVTPTGASGDPSNATLGKGKKLDEVVLANVGGFCEEDG